MHPLTEYPRPAMRRDSYENLNGLWKYAITSTADHPAAWDGDILVPLSLIHISEPTRPPVASRMPSSA